VQEWCSSVPGVRTGRSLVLVVDTSSCSHSFSGPCPARTKIAGCLLIELPIQPRNATNLPIQTSSIAHDKLFSLSSLWSWFLWFSGNCILSHCHSECQFHSVCKQTYPLSYHGNTMALGSRQKRNNPVCVTVSKVSAHCRSITNGFLGDISPNSSTLTATNREPQIQVWRPIFSLSRIQNDIQGIGGGGNNNIGSASCHHSSWWSNSRPRRLRY